MVGLLNPVAGVVIGIALAGEAFGVAQALGMVLVLGGVLLGQPAVRAMVRSRRRDPVRALVLDGSDAIAEEPRRAVPAA